MLKELEKIFSTGIIEVNTDGETIRVHSNTTLEQGIFLQKIFNLVQPNNTLEVGLAYGISALFILEMHKMNNQKNGSLQGLATPFKLKFSAKVTTDDIKTDVVIRKLMDASDKEGDHFNIVLVSQRVVMMYKRAQTTDIITEPTAILYPNPNKGEFKIDLELLPNTTMNASIYDYQGKLMINLGDVESVGNVTKITKTVTQPELPQGGYLLVLSGYNKKITKPFIKL